MTQSTEEDEPMIAFLSFPRRDEKYDKVASALRERGITVLTNFDRTSESGAEIKTDLRLARIRRSDAFVFFAPEFDSRQWSPLRQIEFGYALGCEIPVAYVGAPANSLHRYGDTFDDIDEFLERFYSDSYLRELEKWYTDREGKASVA